MLAVSRVEDVQRDHPRLGAGGSSLYYEGMLQTPRLREGIEGLYRVFQRYELRSDLDPCPCCHMPQQGQRLRHTPLNKLSRIDLRDYAMDAVYTWGTGDDFKHFIPRLFELLAQTSEQRDFVDPASVFGRLTYESWCSSSWRTWPADEQLVLTQYLAAAWDAALNSNPQDLAFDGAYGWIQAIAQAEHDLAPYLDLWQRAPSANAHRHLALMITQNGLPNAQSPTGGYWAGHKEQWEQLNAWLRLPEVHQKLTSAVERWSDSAFATELIEAAILLQ
jgi:hypothetical protein